MDIADLNAKQRSTLSSAPLSGLGLRAPVEISDVNAEWFTELFSNGHPGARVTGCEIVDVIRGCAAKVRVKLSYNDVGRAADLPQHLCLKAGFGLHDEDLERYTHHAEVRSYRDIVPTLYTNTIRCYYADIDSEERAVLVFEDLIIRGVSFCKILNGLSVDRATGFLELFAKMHSRWWDRPELKAGGIYHVIPETMGHDGGHGAYNDFCFQPENWRSLMARPQARVIPRRYRDLSNFSSAIDRLSTVWKEGVQCIIHGDEHLDNLFEDADGRPGVYDWVAKRSSWSQTFAYFLVCALDPEDRRKNEKELLSHYLRHLARLGVVTPTLDEALLSYRQAIFYGLFVWGTTDPAIQSIDKNVAAASRFSIAALDHDSLGALGL